MKMKEKRIMSSYLHIAVMAGLAVLTTQGASPPITGGSGTAGGTSGTVSGMSGNAGGGGARNQAPGTTGRLGLNQALIAPNNGFPSATQRPGGNNAVGSAERAPLAERAEVANLNGFVQQTNDTDTTTGSAMDLWNGADTAADFDAGIGSMAGPMGTSGGTNIGLGDRSGTTKGSGLGAGSTTSAPAPGTLNQGRSGTIGTGTVGRGTLGRGSLSSGTLGGGVVGAAGGNVGGSTGTGLGGAVTGSGSAPLNAPGAPPTNSVNRFPF